MMRYLIFLLFPLVVAAEPSTLTPSEINAGLQMCLANSNSAARVAALEALTFPEGFGYYGQPDVVVYPDDYYEYDLSSYVGLTVAIVVMRYEALSNPLNRTGSKAYKLSPLYDRVHTSKADYYAGLGYFFSSGEPPLSTVMVTATDANGRIWFIPPDLTWSASLTLEAFFVMD